MKCSGMAVNKMVSLGPGLVSTGTELVSLGSIYHLATDADVSTAMNCLVSQKADDFLSTSATSSV